MALIAPYYPLQVVGSISTWIDPDSRDPLLKAQSVATLRQQLAWAGHLGLQAVLLPPLPQPLRCAHYSQVCIRFHIRGYNRDGVEWIVNWISWDSGRGQF